MAAVTAPKGANARHRMRAVSLITVTAVAILGVLGLAAAAEGSHRYARTTVTLTARGLDLSGFVSSRNRARCANNRVVTVFRQRGGRQNPRTDTRIASDNASLSAGRYMWSTGNTGQSGRLYARVARIRGCRADTSPTVLVGQP